LTADVLTETVPVGDVGDSRADSASDVGSSLNITLGPDIQRKLDPYSKDENCMMCLASNEDIVNNTKYDEDFDKSTFIYTVFCELPDFSQSQCCKVVYDSSNAL